MWRDGETPDLRSERRSSMREYRNMASPSKAAYSERKRQKSTFILTVNSPVYPPIQGKENRLFLRPFIAAKETGGLDFLIAHALLIVCHSLFEVVIKPVPQGGKLVILPRCVNSVVDRDIAHSVFGKYNLYEFARFQIVSAKTGEVFGNNRRHSSGFHFLQHRLQSLALKTHAGKSVVQKNLVFKKWCSSA